MRSVGILMTGTTTTLAACDVRNNHRTSVGRELAFSALRAERHELADAVAPVAPLLGDRGELVDLAVAFGASDCGLVNHSSQTLTNRGRSPRSRSDVSPLIAAACALHAANIELEFVSDESLAIYCRTISAAGRGSRLRTCHAPLWSNGTISKMIRGVRAS